MFDQRIADYIGFAILDKVEIVPGFDAASPAQFVAHRREAQFDVVIAEENSQTPFRI